MARLMKDTHCSMKRVNLSERVVLGRLQEVSYAWRGLLWLTADGYDIERERIEVSLEFLFPFAIPRRNRGERNEPWKEQGWTDSIPSHRPPLIPFVLSAD